MAPAREELACAKNDEARISISDIPAISPDGSVLKRTRVRIASQIQRQSIFSSLDGGRAYKRPKIPLLSQ